MRLRPLAGRSFLEVHQHATVRSPRWAFGMPRFDEFALSCSVGTHDADVEPSAVHFGKGDQIAARRPDWRSIIAVAEADALGAASVGIHHINLLRAAAIGLKRYPLAVRRIARCRTDGGSAGQLLDAVRAKVHRINVRRAAVRQGKHDALPVRRKTRRECHVVKIAQNRLRARIDVKQINARAIVVIGHERAEFRLQVGHRGVNTIARPSDRMRLFSPS